MSKENDYKLSHIAFVVLGLVSEHPSHGKDIDKRIEERGMRNWTAIGTSSIYGVLKILKKKNLVESWIEEFDNRMFKVYQITDKGIEVLKKNIYEILSRYDGKHDENYYVAFSMLPYLSQEEQIEVFTNSLIKIIKAKEVLEEMLEKNINYPLNVKGLFIHPIRILETDINFLEWVLEEIKKGAGQIDPEAYNK